MEIRIAHLEGAYEQVDKRLGCVELALTQLRSEMRSSMDSLRSEMVSSMESLRSELRAEINSSTGSLRSEMNSSMTALRSETHQLRMELAGRMDGQFRWLLGTIFTTWITLLVAIFFRS